MNEYEGYEGWKQWGNDTFGTWSVDDAAYFSAEFKRSGIVSCQGLRIFEIGFGNGNFAGYVQSMGGEYFGSEVNGNLIKRAKDFGLDVFEGGIEQALLSDKFGTVDIVVAFDVLEHMEVADIRSFLLNAAKLLRPDGIIIARVPSGDSPFGRANFHGDITHFTALGSSAVRQLAAQTGFEVIDIGPPSLPILGLGLKRAIRRSGVLLAQKIIARLINLFFHDGQPRVITGNLFFALRSSEKL